MLSQHRYLWNSPIGKTIAISVHSANAVCYCLVFPQMLGVFAFVLSQETRASLMITPSLQRSSDGEIIRCCNGSFGLNEDIQ